MAPFGISVIICSHNGANRIQGALEALRSQQLPDWLAWEVIVVDNASTDGTSEQALEFARHLHRKFPLRVIREPKPGKAHAVAAGYSQAMFELMLLCDDDNHLNPQYLAIAAEIYLENPGIGLLGGYGIAFFGNEPMPAWFPAYEQCYVCGKHHHLNGPLKKGDYSIWGAGSVIRKSLWEFLVGNGFFFVNSTGPGKPMGEDTELSHAVMYTGQSLFFDDRLWFTHDLRGGRITRNNLIRQMRINGKSSALFEIYFVAHENRNKSRHSLLPVLFPRMLYSLASMAIKLFTPGKFPWFLYYFEQEYALIFSWKKYKTIYLQSIPWIKAVSGSFPLLPLHGPLTPTRDR